MSALTIEMAMKFAIIFCVVVLISCSVHLDQTEMASKLAQSVFQLFIKKISDDAILDVVSELVTRY